MPLRIDPHALFALGSLIGSSVSDYVRELRAAIPQLFGRGGLEAALREEHARVAGGGWLSRRGRAYSGGAHRHLPGGAEEPRGRARS